MAGIGQYLKDTQGELRHVAWPTRTQTVVYTILVFLLSVGVALYLGLFDFLFTHGLSKLVGVVPENLIQVTQQPASPSQGGPAQTTATPAPSFNISTSTQ